MAVRLLLVVLVVYSPLVLGRACVELVIEPGKTVPTWEEFVRSYPPFSIAIDGFVEAPTRRDLKGPHGNLDHHSGVDRLSTRSTADQAYMEINMGLYHTFQKNGEPFAIVYANDCDEDVATAVWILRHPELVVNGGSDALQRLVFFNDRMDVTAGAFPMPARANRERNWIYEPYHIARKEHRLGKLTAKQSVAIIDAIGDRITAFVEGRGGESPIDTSYRVLERGQGWTFVGDTGADARHGLITQGVQAYAMDLGNGRFVIGRLSEWIPFPLPEIFAALNKAEAPGVITAQNHWGGSGTIGGSPRFTGSRLSVAQIKRVIDEVVASYSRL